MNTESLRQKAIEAKALAEKATSGPWEKKYACGDSARYRSPDLKINLNTTASWSLGPQVRSTSQAMRDAEFIAESRTLVPELAEAVLQLLSEREKMIKEFELIAYWDKKIPNTPSWPNQILRARQILKEIGE